MPELTVDAESGQTVEVNGEGFLTDRLQWTPQVAEILARGAGIETLTERHWKVITCCREDAARHGKTPGLRRISELSGVAASELNRLFPSGPGELAALIAGLSKP